MVRTWRAASMAEEKCTQKLLTKIWRHEMSLEVIGVVGSTLLNGYKVCGFWIVPSVIKRKKIVS